MDTEKICRCCLALDVPLLSIYDGGSAGMGCVADMLKQIAKLLPNPTDNMPEKACLQCISEINRCYVFKIKCENSNRTLRQLLPDAVREPLDIVPKKVLVTSSAVQTEDKILISSMVQTVGEVSNSSVQTVEEEKPLISHKGIQTENEISESDGPILESHDENLESIVIYEDIENSSEIIKKRLSCSPESTQLKKKMCLESSQESNFLAVEESESTVQQSSAYILLEDSNCSEEPDMYVTSSVENQKDSESDRFEYYENEEETQNEQKQFSSRDDPNENLNTDVYDMESSEGFAKSSEESEAAVNHTKSTVFTRASSRPKGQYKCSQCIMTFVSIKVLKRHLANRHDIKDADVVIDYLPAAIPDEIAGGADESSFDNRAKLSNCNKELTSENVAKPQLTPRERVTPSVNEEMLPNVNYFCDYCQAGFAQRKTLTYHVKHQVCMASNFKCNICESIFISEENLETHKLTHENPHKCLECDTVCKTIDELSQHMIKKHNRSARNQCHICKKVFTMRTSLMDHLRIHSGEKPFLCTICGKSFRQNSNLRQHLIRHTNEKNFKCDICPNAYVTKAELFSHKRTHTGDHPFKCDICEARFTTSCSLKKHMRKHTGERPYACEFCPMRFAALNVLKNHRRIHTGEKPFKCAHCQRCFTQKGDCLLHERTHNSDVFKCFCESKFSKKSNLTHHIKTQHPDFSEQEIQTLLDKSVGDTSNTEFQITLMADTEEKINSPNGDNDNDSDGFVAISEEKTSLSNEEILEIVMHEVG